MAEPVTEKRQPGTDPTDLVASSETGARAPKGMTARVLVGVALMWSLFQLWYASPLPFIFGFGVLNDTEARSIHLALAIFLTFIAFPAFKRSPRERVPLFDWLLALLGALSAAYLFLFYAELSGRAGAPTDLDLVVGVVGMILLLEATRRALGPPLMIVAIVFLIYTFGGPHMPDVIAHKGASLSKAMSHQWLSTEGVFGIALGVSTSFVFLFVLFGALLEAAGAGNYFIKVAFSLLGHMRGGPAKAAVVSSAMTGLISGSSIANVVTTGTFTIPLMKRVGFPPEKAGAFEVAASTNGQLTPPVMGAAAFLMVEYVGISYVEVIKHALLPAIISYIALIYIVHLEALKSGMTGLPRYRPSTFVRSLMTFVATVSGLVILAALVYYGLGWIKTATGSASPFVAAALLLVAYLALVRYASGVPDLPLDIDTERLPDPGPTIRSGLHFLLPLVVLVWCLTVERFSPGLSAFWATAFMIGIVVTQRPLLTLFRASGGAGAAFRRGLTDLFEGLVSGARNMIGIGVATAAAGIVVGTVTLTGIGLVMTEFVEFISGGNLMLMLLFTAAISLLLGMGLPTTANYIVVSTLMAPVIVTLGAQAGLVVPLIAVHMFVFYFGILADDTPPVGLAAFAAAAISGGDPIRTGLQGFTYDIRTAILPFMFIFNTQLLLIGIESWYELAGVVVAAVAAMLTFAAATQGFFLVRSRLWESLALLLIAFTLFRPGFWLDQVQPPFVEMPPAEVVRLAEAAPSGGDLRVVVEGPSFDNPDERFSKAFLLPLGESGSGDRRLEDNAGLVVTIEDERALLDEPFPGTRFFDEMLAFDFYGDEPVEIAVVKVEAERFAKELFYVPALLLLGLIVLLQRRRAAVSAS